MVGPDDFLVLVLVFFFTIRFLRPWYLRFDRGMGCAWRYAPFPLLRRVFRRWTLCLLLTWEHSLNTVFAVRYRLNECWWFGSYFTDFFWYLIAGQISSHVFFAWRRELTIREGIPNCHMAPLIWSVPKSMLEKRYLAMYPALLANVELQVVVRVTRWSLCMPMLSRSWMTKEAGLILQGRHSRRDQPETLIYRRPYAW
jgi:hypothetical protein